MTIFNFSFRKYSLKVNVDSTPTKGPGTFLNTISLKHFTLRTIKCIDLTDNMIKENINNEDEDEIDEL